MDRRDDMHVEKIACGRAIEYKCCVCLEKTNSLRQKSEGWKGRWEMS